MLDVGPETGLAGESLAASGIGPVGVVDISDKMLDIALPKWIYRNFDPRKYHTAFKFSAIKRYRSCSHLYVKHVGLKGVLSLIGIANPGCLFIISVNAGRFASAGFEAYLANLETRIIDLIFK